MREKRKIRSTALLFLTAIIWGFAFVAQSEGNVMGPFTFNGIRNLLGTLALIPFIRIFYGNLRLDKDTLIGGICCGLCLFAASNLQQYALLYTSPGKTGFITACYMILVPITGICFGKRLRLRIGIAVVFAALGLYLLCIPKGEGFTDINKGDMLALLCALCYTFHILCIDHFTVKAEGVKMACIQFFCCAVLTLLLAFIFEEPSLPAIRSGLLPLLYAGICSSGVAYSLQIMGQRDVEPSVASMILSLESCFSVIAGFLLLGTALSLRELLGCAVMFIGIIITQLPERKEEISS
ncbi:MAG TPA: DMT family transporter [Candidatus Avilachnospira avistercoris]|nr:DMT family transporter [Candidatus Avilachnospira avistercoris]